MLNVRLYNSQHHKLKSPIKNGTEVTLNLSSKLIGNSNDKTNFLHKLLLTDTTVSKQFHSWIRITTLIITVQKFH